MNTNHLFFKADKAGLVLGAVLLATLTGCVGNAVGPPAGDYAQTTVFDAQDDYVYYPAYNVYYSSHRHQYDYVLDRGWVSRPAPGGVAVDVLLASPSVKMDFHDSPALHHAEVVQKYPKDWTPPGANHT